MPSFILEVVIDCSRERNNYESATMIYFILLILIVAVLIFKAWDYDFKPSSEGELLTRRQEYYRNVYLKSDEWQRKRYVVLKRDNWCCQYCGGKATQVHHTRYLKRNLGREPIEWLVSICKPCHDAYTIIPINAFQLSTFLSHS